MAHVQRLLAQARATLPLAPRCRHGPFHRGVAPDAPGWHAHRGTSTRTCLRLRRAAADVGVTLAPVLGELVAQEIIENKTVAVPLSPSGRPGSASTARTPISASRRPSSCRPKYSSADEGEADAHPVGAFIVADPKDPKVDLDTTMVLNDGPLGFTINGKSFPATAPLVASKGDLVRIRYMNEGLQIHPMHLHGIPQKADFYTAKLEGELGEPETKPIS